MWFRITMLLRNPWLSRPPELRSGPIGSSGLILAGSGPNVREKFRTHWLILS